MRIIISQYTSMYSSQVTVQKIKDSYLMLSSGDIDASRDANHFLNTLSYRQQIWDVCKEMIAKQPSLDFQLLGTQILYQKVSAEIVSLPSQRKIEIRDFAFGVLQTANIVCPPIIDKLASICALLACSMYLNQWKTFMSDVFGFMKISDYCLLAGLYILERFPEQLRRTNRISSGLKNTIIQQALKYEQDMVQSFKMILDLNNNNTTNRCLKTMATWAESKFNFLKYPNIIQTVLILSLQDFEKLQSALDMIFQTIRGSSMNKIQSLSNIQPSKQLQSYSQQQLKSVKYILSYITQNKQNFFNSNFEPEQIEVFASIIRQSLLDFGFLINQPIGFNLLEIIIRFTSSSDLKTSRNNFQFWIDFSDKVANSKLTTEIKNYFAEYLLKAFKIINQKATVPDYLLDDPDLKQDLTIDDLNNITVTQYRKDAVSFYQFVYDFFFKLTTKSNFFFQQCFAYIESDINQNKLAGGTEIALFCIKSAAESMVSPEDSVNLRKVIGFIMQKSSLAPPRVVAEILMLIRDCTKEIKDEQGFSFKCLQYSMKYLSNDILSFDASDAFKCMLQTFSTINDASFVDSLLNFYSQTDKLKDNILDRVVDGIISIIFKISNPQFIKSYIQKFMQMIFTKFQSSHQMVMQNPNLQKPYFTPLVQLKAIMVNYDNCNKQIKMYLRQYFLQLSKNALQMINIVIPFCLKNQYKYILVNELGLSCSIFKYVIRTSVENIDPLFLQTIQHSFSVLTPQKIVEMGAVLNLLNQSFITLMGHSLGFFNEWIMKKIPYFNNFFCNIFSSSIISDPDAVRRCYEVLQNLILYNSSIFLNLDKAEVLFDYALHYLRHINEQKMQRKLVSFIHLCMRQQGIVDMKKQKVLEIIISSIPILHSQSVANFSKILAIVLNSLPFETHRPILNGLLRKNPYQDISANTINIMIESILMALNIGNQRYIMMVVKDLTEITLNGENPQGAIQYQFRLNLWKKELNKKKAGGLD